MLLLSLATMSVPLTTLGSAYIWPWSGVPSALVSWVAKICPKSDEVMSPGVRPVSVESQSLRRLPYDIVGMSACAAAGTSPTAVPSIEPTAPTARTRRFFDDIRSPHSSYEQPEYGP